MTYKPGVVAPPTTTAANDFQVGSGAGAWIKKTLAEIKTILGLGSAAYTASTDYAVAAKGVTNGDSHNHNGGDGAQIAYADLSGLPTLPTYTARTTFNPVVAGTSTAGAGTYSQQIGEYSRLGNIVFFTINLIWSAHTGTGNMKITGLPVTAANNSFTYASIVAWSNVTLAAAGNKIFGNISANTTEIPLIEVGSGAVSNLPMDAAATLRISGFYFV